MTQSFLHDLSLWKYSADELWSADFGIWLTHILHRGKTTAN